MDIDESITVTKINIQDGYCYMMIIWQSTSFEMFLYNKDKLWKGRFSSNRLAGFSRNLHMTENAYLTSLKRCLSQQRDNYRYEFKSGFFYWKRKLKDTVVIEGFLPMELDQSPKNTQPDLVEILLNINKQLEVKINSVIQRFKSIKTDYHKCLRDTEEFLNLKIEMEKSLCDKFLDLLSVKKLNIYKLEHSKAIAFDENCSDLNVSNEINV